MHCCLCLAPLRKFTCLIVSCLLQSRFCEHTTSDFPVLANCFVFNFGMHSQPCYDVSQASAFSRLASNASAHECCCCVKERIGSMFFWRKESYSLVVQGALWVCTCRFSSNTVIQKERTLSMKYWNCCIHAAMRDIDMSMHSCQTQLLADAHLTCSLTLSLLCSSAYRARRGDDRLCSHPYLHNKTPQLLVKHIWLMSCLLCSLTSWAG